ncbi:BnaC06g10510D [Brassica napus]|uniref:Uncharacterized protein n=2 Tax=Brassica TaxID=3705 RepID=A0A0D3CSA6_BRAOL|nr:unnamed protein product [Brassica napus]CDY26145.1 BnaC06g10510D [Brassica napus]
MQHGHVGRTVKMDRSALEMLETGPSKNGGTRVGFSRLELVMCPPMWIAYGRSKPNFIYKDILSHLKE